ncbi:hypothetical protein SpiGrapes_0012 [Sphaerochaeta pleomorpha str. Grapes]|uniref:Uncharacterized protein n=1 Tax=Sphaerochaeta pleomorpha (strain ATCC BAA-1885 / DSM 22778 / Grapes) TaxID=158190 RepID=G8QSI1_SPHPG|nr:hypothetical protein [Sphaerochaeta pleomorpha]AEV27880.1 hypothetical protein SpiGrapes_0012 [Sphaerochaeta pleomorpha str. Grapes]
MKKGAIVVLVFSTILVLCGLGLIIGSFLSSSPVGVVHQNAYGFMVNMRFSSPMPMAYAGSASLSLMLMVLGCTLLNTGVILLALGLYLFMHVHAKPEYKVREKRQVSELQPAVNASTEDRGKVVDVEEKQ